MSSTPRKFEITDDKTGESAFAQGALRKPMSFSTRSNRMFSRTWPNQNVCEASHPVPQSKVHSSIIVGRLFAVLLYTVSATHLSAVKRKLDTCWDEYDARKPSRNLPDVLPPPRYPPRSHVPSLALACRGWPTALEGLASAC